MPETMNSQLIHSQDNGFGIPLVNGLYHEDQQEESESNYGGKKMAVQVSVVKSTPPPATTDHGATKWWDPRRLLTKKLYQVDYNPLVENRPRFRNMEGHLEVFGDEPIVEPIEKPWKKLYFRTKEGRFEWYATHCADEHPSKDILLTGTTVTTNKDDWTITIKGGKETVDITLRVPSGVYDKWRQALLSHSHSTLIDSYVQPIQPPVPHYTQHVVIIELGTCSIRAGLLTNKPSLPMSFFPAVACVSRGSGANKHVLECGIDSFDPNIRVNGHLESPIQENLSETGVERYRFNKPVVEACIRKVIADLHAYAQQTSSRFDPNKYRVLLSIPQDIPSSFVADFMRTFLQSEFGFQGVAIARQPSLILYSYDVTTGVVVDIGERLSIVPVIDEYIVENAIVSLPFGAQQIRACLRRRLRDMNNGLAQATAAITGFNSVLEQILLRCLVEQTCYVVGDYDEESKEGLKNGALENVVAFDQNEIPNGVDANFKVDNVSRFHATEGLFKPKLWGIEMNGIHRLVHEAIQQCPIDSRRTLYRNIFLTGGTSLLPGLAERLEQELCKIVPLSIFVQVMGSPWRYHSAYLGGQILASGLQFESSCVTRLNVEQYIKQLQTTTRD